MNEDQIAAIVRGVLEQAAPGARIDGLDPAAPFRDQFEFDSVDYVNFVFGLEKAFSLKISDIDCPQLSTLAGCLSYLRPRV